MSDRWLEELGELIAIPSVSADPGRAREVWVAADWVDAYLRRAGASSEVVTWHGQPLVVGDLRASSGDDGAPTVLLYGHVDVQGEDPIELWDGDPFSLEVRGDWAYGRGVVDDKGSLYMLLRAACDLAAQGALPVNVRILCDAEEETFGTSAGEYVEADDGAADACLIYDWGMSRPDVPEFCIGTRGAILGKVTVQTAEGDMHSGGVGGAALNAIHALNRALAGVCAREGCLPDELRQGVEPAGDEELRTHEQLPDGSEALAAAGGRPADAGAVAEYYRRVQLEPTVEVIGIVGGSPQIQKTIVPAHAEARLSIRLAAGQDPEVIRLAVERLLHASAPAGAELDFECFSLTPASSFAADSPAIQLGREGFERALGRRPLLTRSGGTLPVMAALQARGIATILTGFGLPDSHVHAPNERLLARYMPLGIHAAKQTLQSLAGLR